MHMINRAPEFLILSALGYVLDTFKIRLKWQVLRDKNLYLQLDSLKRLRAFDNSRLICLRLTTDYKLFIGSILENNNKVQNIYW